MIYIHKRKKFLNNSDSGTFFVYVMLLHKSDFWFLKNFLL